jgi:four helix bundle protein
MKKPLHTLVAYQVALQVVQQLEPIVGRIKQHDRNLADQLRRAATSVVCNIAEGQRREGGNKQRAYEIASGEANEVLGCLDLAAAWGWPQDDQAARYKLGRLLRLLDGLVTASALGERRAASASGA